MIVLVQKNFQISLIFIYPKKIIHSIYSHWILYHKYGKKTAGNSNFRLFFKILSANIEKGYFQAQKLVQNPVIQRISQNDEKKFSSDK